MAGNSANAAAATLMRASGPILSTVDEEVEPSRFGLCPASLHWPAVDADI